MQQGSELPPLTRRDKNVTKCTNLFRKLRVYFADVNALNQFEIDQLHRRVYAFISSGSPPEGNLIVIDAEGQTSYCRTAQRARFVTPTFCSEMLLAVDTAPALISAENKSPSIVLTLPNAKNG